MRKLATLIIIISFFLFGCVTVNNQQNDKPDEDTFVAVEREISLPDIIPINISLIATSNPNYEELSIGLRSSEINLFQMDQEDLISGNIWDSKGSKIFINLIEKNPFNLQFTSNKKNILRQNISPKTHGPINFIQLNIGYGEIYYRDKDGFISPKSDYLPNGSLEGNTVYFVDESALDKPYYVTRTEFGDAKNPSGFILDREIPSYVKSLVNSVKNDPFEGGGALFIPFKPIDNDWCGNTYELNITLDLNSLFKSDLILNDHIGGTPLDLSISLNELDGSEALQDLPIGQWKTLTIE